MLEKCSIGNMNKSFINFYNISAIVMTNRLEMVIGISVANYAIFDRINCCKPHGLHSDQHFIFGFFFCVFVFRFVFI